MFNGQDRRIHERREADYWVEITSPHRDTGHIQDISAGGAMMAVSLLPERNTELNLNFTLPGWEAEAVLTCEVVWSMKGDGVSSISAVGIRWIRALVKDRSKAKEFLGEVLNVQGGFAKGTHEGILYTFAVPEGIGDTADGGTENEAEASMDVPAPPPPVDSRTADDSPSVGASADVSIPAKYKAAGKMFKGVITTIAERRVVVETRESLPSHSDRIEVRASIPSSEGLLPLKLYGQVSRTKQATSERSASFWVLITKVDECGRPGLFRQYVDYLG